MKWVIRIVGGLDGILILGVVILFAMSQRSDADVQPFNCSISRSVTMERSSIPSAMVVSSGADRWPR